MTDLFEIKAGTRQHLRPRAVLAVHYRCNACYAPTNRLQMAVNSIHEWTDTWKEPIGSFRDNDGKSNYTTHLIEYDHETTTMQTSMQLLHNVQQK